MKEEAKLLDTYWLMFVGADWYPIHPSNLCQPKDHAELNPHVTRIEDADGNVLWERGALH